ncbi:MAG: hypothetical protein VX544_04280, partial [Pseudomonadota bacterium]|nr:hypothetical protein [Pseudomonadota bacterium]
FKDGLLHGEMKFQRYSGWTIVNYQKGILHGSIRKYKGWHKGYEVPSYLYSELHFEGGVPSGIQTWYDPSGKIIETAFYQRRDSSSTRMSHEKIFHKEDVAVIPSGQYINMIQKYLEECSNSEVKILFDQDARVDMFVGNQLDPNCLQQQFSDYRKNATHFKIYTRDNFPWGKFTGERDERRVYPDDYDENISFSKDESYISILAPDKVACGEICEFTYDHLIFFEDTFIYLTDSYGEYSYITEIDKDSIQYAMAMGTHHRHYRYNVKDILNAQGTIDAMYLYGDFQTQKEDYYITSWEKTYWDRGGALWISTKRNYQNEILELLDGNGNVCDTISGHVESNIWRLPNSFGYERFKIQVLAYLTRNPQPKWWLAALPYHAKDRWCYTHPKM